MDDIYDTTIYSDFADLPKDKQKALYKEFTASDERTKNNALLLFVVPLVGYSVALLLLIASFVVVLVKGLCATFIALISAVVVVLVCFIFVKVRLDKLKTEHEEKFAEWLKINKRIIAKRKNS